MPKIYVCYLGRPPRFARTELARIESNLSITAFQYYDCQYYFWGESRLVATSILGMRYARRLPHRRSLLCRCRRAKMTRSLDEVEGLSKEKLNQLMGPVVQGDPQFSGCGRFLEHRSKRTNIICRTPVALDSQVPSSFGWRNYAPTPWANTWEALTWYGC